MVEGNNAHRGTEEPSLVDLYQRELRLLGARAVDLSRQVISRTSALAWHTIVLTFQGIFCFVNICCCCWLLVCLKKSNISEDEKGRFIRLSHKAIKPYEKENSTNENMVMFLFEKAFGVAEASRLERNLLSEKWKEIGFQTNDPRKDFRSGGVLGLANIISFIENEPRHFEEMVDLTRRDLFLFACNSIRVTSFLRMYFEFDKLDKETPVSWEGKAKRNRTKNLCHFLSTEADGSLIQRPDQSYEEAYTRLHHILLIEIFKVWQEQLTRGTDLTLLQISMAELDAEARFVRLIEQRLFKGIKEFELALKATTGHEVPAKLIEAVRSISH